jgi:hypothetical protein
MVAIGARAGGWWEPRSRGRGCAHRLRRRWPHLCFLLVVGCGLPRSTPPVRRRHQVPPLLPASRAAPVGPVSSTCPSRMLPPLQPHQQELPPAELKPLEHGDPAGSVSPQPVLHTKPARTITSLSRPSRGNPSRDMFQRRRRQIRAYGRRDAKIRAAVRGGETERVDWDSVVRSCRRRSSGLIWEVAVDRG